MFSRRDLELRPQPLENRRTSGYIRGWFPTNPSTREFFIRNRDVGLVNDPLYVKALVIRNESMTAVIVTVDAVAIEEIGSIKSDYLPTVRAAIEKDLKIKPANVMINASHCHGVVCADVTERTIKAIKLAAAKLVPVTVGVGRGFEDRVQENRRLKLKDGRTIDVRHAYSMSVARSRAAAGCR